MRVSIVSISLGLALLAAACTQTTGGEIVDFPVAAAGAPDARAGEPLRFETANGWSVVLTKATLHVGAVYLDSAAPVSGAQDTPCILPGTYVAQMTSGMDIDLLSPVAQRFPARGHGTTSGAIVGQLWLTGLSELAGGDIDTPDDPTPILVVAGTATSGGDLRPFAGQITIGTNRQASGALAGSAPLCKQRVVSVLTEVQIGQTGGLLVRIDARRLFSNVDFGALENVAGAYTFADLPSADQPSTNLYANLHAGSGPGSPYSFSWSNDLK